MTSPSGTRPLAPHVLTVDLEDWFHCLEPNPGRWPTFARRAEQETSSLLDLLERHRAKATFFVLGDVVSHCPHLVSEIARRGHEIGSHGMWHRFVYKQSVGQFRDDLRRSLNLLRPLVGGRVQAYRAPYFSVTSESLWALEVLACEGISIDSSVFPIRNPRYGIPGARRTPYEVLPGLWEWPVSTLPTPMGNLPIGGGVYLRFLTAGLLRAALAVIERRGEPVILYIHPWELDPDQPRHRPSSRFLAFRHYYGLHRTRDKLADLLSRARYVSLSDAAAIMAESNQ